MSRFKSTIIGILTLVLIPLLGGCSSVRLAYSTGPQLAWWWVDGYFDFSSEQAVVVKQGLTELFDWHRSTQLPEYLPVLAAAQAQVVEPTTPAQACRWQVLVREKLEPTLERALGLAADNVPSLGEAQFKHLEGRYAKALAEMRDDYLQPNPSERQAESLKRALERAERLYGRLGDAQKRVLGDGVAASPFNPELWLAERQRRQRDTLRTLRRLVAEKSDRDQRLAALRALVVRMERSPNAEYSAYQIKLGDYNCALAAQLHNATTPAQRRVARETLKGWEEDLRSLR